MPSVVVLLEALFRYNGDAGTCTSNYPLKFEDHSYNNNYYLLLILYLSITNADLVRYKLLAEHLGCMC